MTERLNPRRTGLGHRKADADAEAVRQASRTVGLQIAAASAVLVLGVLGAALIFVLRHISPTQLFDIAHRHETTIDVGGIDILVAGIVIGAVAIVLAGTLSIFATRRAVRPLGDALRMQRTFIADASHELRTPLAVIDARLQLLQRSLDTADPSAPVVAELRRDAKNLIDVVNDLLISVEVRDSPNTQPVDAGPTILRAVDSMRVIAAEKNVTIVMIGSEAHDAATAISAASMHRCIIALLDNALDFAPANSVITVSLSVDSGVMRLSIRDEGPGIHGIDPARIFDRFARSGTAVDGGGTTRTGFGIGLSLVRDTVERVGGRAAVAHTSATGTEIELVIPCAR